MIEYCTIHKGVPYGKGALLIFEFGQDPQLVDNQDDFDDNIFPNMARLNSNDKDQWDKGHIMAKSLGGEATLRNFFPVAHNANLQMEEIENKMRCLCNDLQNLKDKFCRLVTNPQTADYVRNSNLIKLQLHYMVAIDSKTNNVNGILVPASIAINVYFEVHFNDSQQTSEIHDVGDNYADEIRRALNQCHSRYFFKDIIQTNKIIQNTNS